MVSVSGLGSGVDEAVVRVLLHDGEGASNVLRPSKKHWIIPRREGPLDAVSRFIGLGFMHILGGADHLLFVAGLLILMGSGRLRRLLLTISSFTLAHTLTLGATAVGWVRVNPRAAEALIALTLIFLALEALRSMSSTDETTREGPWIAFVFGLVHGLGFAGALRDVGLPENALVPSLFGFNIGVELGQCFFIGIWMSIEALVFHGPMRPSEPIALIWRKTGSYIVGGLGMYWLLSRLPWASF